jgi:sugar-specific transcriptional regulator TrmB
MNTKILEKIGLTEGEVRVYLALLELGLCSTGQIIDKSQITSSKVYIILERLEQKGLVSHVIKNNVRHFQSANPNKILDYLEEKKKEIEEDSKIVKELLPSLIEKREKFSNIQETTMYQGAKGFQTARDEFISDLNKGDCYYVFGSEDPLNEVYKNTIRKFNIDNEKKGIKTKLIYHTTNKAIREIFKGFKTTNVKFVNTHVPSSIAISKSKVLLMAYGKEPVQVLIQSETLAQSFAKFFEEVWKQAD